MLKRSIEDTQHLLEPANGHPQIMDGSVMAGMFGCAAKADRQIFQESARLLFGNLERRSRDTTEPVAA